MRGHSEPITVFAFPEPTLMLDGSQIPVNDEVNFLGVIFGKKLNFKSHITNLKKKCLKALNVIKMVSSTKWGADRETLLHLYRTLVRSRLDYGSTVFGSARQSYLLSREPLANEALHLCLGAFHTSPIESMQVEATEPALSLRREHLSL